MPLASPSLQKNWSKQSGNDDVSVATTSSRSSASSKSSAFSFKRLLSRSASVDSAEEASATGESSREAPPSQTKKQGRSHKLLSQPYPLQKSASTGSQEESKNNWGGAQVPKYGDSKDRRIMPSPVPSPQASFRKKVHAPRLGSWDDDSSSSSSSSCSDVEKRKKREEEKVKHLVTMAKQQQNLMAAWFAASEGSQFFPVSGPNTSKRKRRQVPTTLARSASQTAAAPIDIDSCEEWSKSGREGDNDDDDAKSTSSNSSSGSSKMRAFLSNMLSSPSSNNSTAACQSLKSEATPRISNVSGGDVEIGIPSTISEEGDDESEDRKSKTLKERILSRNGIILILICLVLVGALTTVTTEVLKSQKDKNQGGSNSPDGLGFAKIVPPSESPTMSPVPTSWPTRAPSTPPAPTFAPTASPSQGPTSSPSSFPTMQPSVSPTQVPTAQPSAMPTISQMPTNAPSSTPTTVFSTIEFAPLGNSALAGTQVGEQSGYSTALSGDGTIMCVGARYYSREFTSRSGRVTCQELRQDDGEWIPHGQVLLGRNDQDQFGSAISLSRDGRRLAISEPGFDGDAGDRSGNVHVYQWAEEGNWVLLGQEIGGEGVADFFGLSLALSGNGKRLAIGAPYHDAGGVKVSGRVRVYEFDGVLWQPVAQPLDGTERLDWFGWHLDINHDGSMLAVGAPRNTEHGGYVKCYSSNTGSLWQQVGNTIVNDIGLVQGGDRFGMAVSLSSDSRRIAIGAPWKNTEEHLNAGMVVVYERRGNTNKWEMLGNPLFGNALAHQFGWSLQLAGDNFMAVGILGNDQVSFHQWNDVLEYWDGASTPLSGNADERDEFGHALSMSKDASILLVGATASGNGGTGYARVYRKR